MATISWTAPDVVGEPGHGRPRDLEGHGELAAEDPDRGGLPGRDRGAEAGRDDDRRAGPPVPDVVGGSGLGGPALVSATPASASAAQDVVDEDVGHGAAVLVDDHELRVERRELVRDQDREREGQPERGQDREDDRRAVADALAQDPAGDHERGRIRSLLAA